MPNEKVVERFDYQFRVRMPMVIVMLPGLLGLMLILWKLTGLIDWPWWLITLPFWFPLAVCALMLGVVFFVVLFRRAL